MRASRLAVAVSVLALVGCPSVAVGCQSVAVTSTTSSMMLETTTSETATTTSTTQRLSVQFGGDGQGVVSPDPTGSSLIGSWSRREADCTVHLDFQPDGTVWLSNDPDEPEYEGDAVFGRYKVSGTTLWVYGIGMEEWSCKYSIKNGVLSMPEPGMDGTVYKWKR